MNNQMQLKEYFNYIKSMEPIDAKVSFFMDRIRESGAVIKDAERVVLCGNTPFAKNVFKHKEWFGGRELIIEDDPVTLDLCEGGVYVLCTRPYLHKYISRLYEGGIKQIFPWQTLIALNPVFGENQIYAYTYEKIIDQIKDIIIHVDDYMEILGNLQDEKSKKVFINMLVYRLTYDWKCNLDVATVYEHYFDEDIINLESIKSFMDCGGYDGDTLDVFRKLKNDCFDEYYLFEPDDMLIKKAMEKGTDGCVFINKGVWSCVDTLKFRKETAAGNGTLKLVNKNEEYTEVPVTSIDAMNISPDFIKMDIEGSEIEALEGAKETVLRHRPVIAVCTYHKIDDYHTIYNKIKEIDDQEMYYKVFLRAQYNNVDTETYYLFVPN